MSFNVKHNVKAMSPDKHLFLRLFLHEITKLSLLIIKRLFICFSRIFSVHELQFPANFNELSGIGLKLNIYRCNYSSYHIDTKKKKKKKKTDPFTCFAQ